MKKHSYTIKGLRTDYLEKKITIYDVLSDIKKSMSATKDYNIWIYQLSDTELKEYTDALTEKKIEDYPLWGIPFAIKDNIDLAGVPTTAACSEFAYTPKHNAFIVDRLIAAGAIPVGKTNMDQFATGLVGTRSPYGEVHNAYRQELISGGSSSGSAVAVALGMAAFSLGTDTAGSGRVPAALNNLVGLKPSVGAWSCNGVVPACKSLDCPSVFTNTLADAMLVDSIIRKEDAEYAYSKAVPTIKETSPAVLYLPKEEPFFYGDFAEKYHRAWKTIVKKAEKQFDHVEYTDTSLLAETASILYDGPWVTERYACLNHFIEQHEDAFFPVTRQIICGKEQEKWKANELFTAIHRVDEIKKITHNLLNGNVLLLPTCGGTFTREQVDANPIATNSLMGHYTNHCNLLDLCALAVPCGFLEEQLPFGVTLFAPSGKEGNLIYAAKRLS